MLTFIFWFIIIVLIIVLLVAAIIGGGLTFWIIIDILGLILSIWLISKLFRKKRKKNKK